jgi:hypothetical protein
MADRIDTSEFLWTLFKAAQSQHMEQEEPQDNDTEAKFRKRAEKAGITAVANYLEDPRRKP